MPQQTVSARSYELLLIAVIAARATSFIFSKMILESLAPFNLLAVRFIIAFVLLALIFNKAVRSLAARDLLAGTVIGTAFFITMACEMIALTQAASSLVSLLENCAIIFVPLLEILLYKKLPGKLTVISTGMAMFGVVLLALGQGELSGGFTWGLAAGLCYAAAIIVTERLSHGSTATLGIGIVQVGTMGVLSFLAMLLTETPQLPHSGSQWLMLAMLIIVCTGFGFTLQPMAQSHVSAARAGLFCAVSPAIAALLGVTVLGEPFGTLDVLGLVLILASIVMPYVRR